jgi:hypothetical protein
MSDAFEHEIIDLTTRQAELEQPIDCSHLSPPLAIVHPVKSSSGEKDSIGNPLLTMDDIEKLLIGH